MAQKRTAREAFGRPKGHLSAVAAAKLAKKQAASPAPQLDPAPDAQDLATAVGSEEYDGHHESLHEPSAAVPREEPPPIPAPRKPDVQLSTFDPRDAVRAADFAFDREIKLDVDETATVVGEYDVVVLQGIITVYGAVLRPESCRTRIYAPSTHALPQLQARQDGTCIRICNLKSAIRKLDRLSQHFRNIWTKDHESYQILKSTHDDPLQRSLSSLQIEKDVDAVLRTLSAKVMVDPRKPRIMAVGAKSSGKSTFNRTLCNHVLSWTPGAKCQYLDLDPGQPEFGPPGQVSLVEVREPLPGPSFTHFAERDSVKLQLLRSHTIAATTFKHDPDHYRDCALDLIKQADPNLPLVVNTCGWVNGLGASVLNELASLLQISDVVILEPLEDEFVQPLKSAVAESTFYRIPRQPPKPSARTPAELRSMQTMAYFHRRREGPEMSGYGGKPVSQARPYTLSFAEPNRSLLAVASYGQAPKPQFLTEVLDGSLVAVVAVERGYAGEFEERIGRAVDGVPYLLPRADGTTRTLDPKHSSCVGLGLIRGIDIQSGSLKLVTPMSDVEVTCLADKEVMLVRGGFDSPEWAYLEDLYYHDDDDEKLEDRPWVNQREMVGVEGAVWRLRHPPLAPSSSAGR